MSLSTLHNSCYNYITGLVSGNIYASIQNTKYALLSLVEFVEIYALFGRTKQTKNLLLGTMKASFGHTKARIEYFTRPNVLRISRKSHSSTHCLSKRFYYDDVKSLEIGDFSAFFTCIFSSA